MRTNEVINIIRPLVIKLSEYHMRVIAIISDGAAVNREMQKVLFTESNNNDPLDTLPVYWPHPVYETPIYLSATRLMLSRN
jgi:hypothetical protein